MSGPGIYDLGFDFSNANHVPRFDGAGTGLAGVAVAPRSEDAPSDSPHDRDADRHNDPDVGRKAMRIAAVIVSVLALALSGPGRGFASTIATTDAAQIAAFQAGATIVTFEGIGGITAFHNQTPGTVVPTAALLKNQISGLTFFSNAIEGPYVLDLTGFGNIGDARSQPNVLAGTSPDGPLGEAVVCFPCFIEVLFASPVSRVGAFNDPTGSRIELLATNQGNILESVQADQGQFIGANTGANNIERALFQFISTQSVNGFSLDNLTFARVSGTAVPEPGTMVLIGTGVAALAWLRRRSRRP